jgi:hypothetical protein
MVDEDEMSRRRLILASPMVYMGAAEVLLAILRSRELAASLVELPVGSLRPRRRGWTETGVDIRIGIMAGITLRYRRTSLCWWSGWRWRVIGVVISIPERPRSLGRSRGDEVAASAEEQATFVQRRHGGE